MPSSLGNASILGQSINRTVKGNSKLPKYMFKSIQSSSRSLIFRPHVKKTRFTFVVFDDPLSNKSLYGTLKAKIL